MAAGAASDRFGLPLPGQAFALSHFRTPHEAPLIGQDTNRIRQVLRTGIGIHSHFRERAISCPGRSAARRSSRRGALQIRGPGYLLPEETGVPVLRSGMKNAASRPGHGGSKRSPHERSDMRDCGTRTVCELIARPYACCKYALMIARPCRAEQRSAFRSERYAMAGSRCPHRTARLPAIPRVGS
jgi:hypothetical protein